MKISVLIPSYNSSATIRWCLHAVTRQQRPADEVIVVDSSDDGTPDVIRSDFPVVELIHLPEKTLPGAARNVGVETASGDVIAFTDADCVPSRQWFSALERGWQTWPEAGGIGGVVGVHNPDSAPGTIGFLLEFSEHIVGTAEGPVDMIPSCNVSYRKEVYEQFGGMSGRHFGGEDVRLARAIARSGMLLRCIPEAIVYHHNRETWQAMISHQRRLGRGFAISRKADPSLPGSFLLSWSWLVPLVPMTRWWRILRRLWARDHALLWQFLLHPTPVWRGLMSWQRGFREGAQEQP